MNKVDFSKPRYDEIEVSVFGPGFGECILIHIGNGRWIIVDSCLNPATKEPSPSEYLDQLGIHTTDIDTIVVTHWHDDHVRGVSKLVEKYKNAKVIVSGAVKGDEFLRLLGFFHRETMIKSSSGVRELTKIIEITKRRRGSIKRAIAERLLVRVKLDDDGRKVHITSLSPSDEAILRSNFEVAKLIPEVKSEIRRIPSIRPNHTAVVLWVSINDINFLLGSDLECSTDQRMGWLNILESETKPEGKAVFFKIPHHGSESSHEQRVWDEMLHYSPIAVVTPFSKGNIKLPKVKDIDRICSLTDKGYITAENVEKRAKFRNRIDKIMKSTVKNRKVLFSSYGHVRCRLKTDKDKRQWKIDCLGKALKLESLLQV